MKEDKLCVMYLAISEPYYKKVFNFVFDSNCVFK